jgi:hypothetical protein
MLRRWVLAALNPNAHVLDLGAGAGIVPEMNFRGLAARVCGVDPDPRVLQNRHLDEGKIGYGEAETGYLTWCGDFRIEPCTLRPKMIQIHASQM